MATDQQKLRIVCKDGTAPGTTVHVVQADGSEVPITDMITEVSINIQADKLAVAIVRFDLVEVDVVGNEDTSAPQG